MTTVVDPAGTVSVINRDQATTVYTVAAAGSTGSTATPLTIYSQVNVVAVTATSSSEGVKLPVGAEGDYIEIYTVSGVGIQVYRDDNSFHSSGGFGILRYVSGDWRRI